MVQSGSPPPGGGYPPPGQPGYPPQGQPGYPPQGQPGYPPQGQPGYPPQGQPGYPPPDAYGGYGGGYPGAPRRSAIPKVIGILLIIFGSLGLLGVLIGLASGGGGMFAQDNAVTHRFYAETATFTRITNLIGLPISVLQIVAGIWAVRYRRAAPLLASTYAVASIANQILSLVLLFAFMLPALEKTMPPVVAERMRGVMMVAAVFGALIGVAWQVVVLILMNRPQAKEACVN